MKNTILFLMLAFIGIRGANAGTYELNCKSQITDQTYLFRGFSNPRISGEDGSEEVRVYLNGERVGRTVVFPEFQFGDRRFFFISSIFFVIETSRLRMLEGLLMPLEDGTFSGTISYDLGRLWNKRVTEDTVICKKNSHYRDPLKNIRAG